MWYYSTGQSDGEIAAKGVAMSALANFIRLRMRELKIKHQKTVASKADITEGTLTNILRKKKKANGEDVIPRPETIRGLGKALEVHPSVLTALLGYPIEPIPDVDDRLYQIAARLNAAPWVAERLDDLLRVPPEDFDDLIGLLDRKLHRQSQRGSGKESSS